MKGFHTTTDLGEDWAAELLEPHIEYSYEQLKEIFALPFKERELKWNKKTSIKEYLILLNEEL